jgi:hypothetical protein
MKYEVGQIIYLLSNNEMKIFPARVEEEIVRKRVGSEEVSYKVALPTKDRNTVSLSDIDASVFTTVQDIRTHMIENAIKTIDTMIEKASRMSRALNEEAASRDPVRDDQDGVE